MSIIIYPGTMKYDDKFTFTPRSIDKIHSDTPEFPVKTNSLSSRHWFFDVLQLNHFHCLYLSKVHTRGKLSQDPLYKSVKPASTTTTALGKRHEGYHYGQEVNVVSLLCIITPR